MRSRLLLVSGLCAAALVAGVSLVRSLSAAPPASAAGRQSDQTPIALSASSDDGKAVYSLEVYQPWEAAGPRVVAFYGASVSVSGLASLSNCRLTDVGAGSDALSVVGELYTCTATLNVSSWSEVHTKSDVTLSVANNN